MPIAFPELPYAIDALQPLLSRATLRVHHEKHHRAYVDKTNQLTDGTALAKLSLEGIVTNTAHHKAKGDIFNNAAQAWNHAFYWNSLSPRGGGKPDGLIGKLIDRQFGNFETFAKEFAAVAQRHFGSGWQWLTLAGDSLLVTTTANADTPIAHGRTPLLTLDLWEHAYYLDYQNRRSDYVADFIGHLANWEFANANLERALHARSSAAE